VRSVTTDYGYKGVTEPPEEEEQLEEPPRAEIPESVEETPPATKEKRVASQLEEDEAKQSSVMFEKVSATDLDSTHKLSSSKTVMVVIGLIAVLVTFSAWMLLDSAPESVDGRAGENALSSIDSRSIAPSEESSTTDQALAPYAGVQGAQSPEANLEERESHIEAASGEERQPREPLRPTEGDTLPVIKLDRNLVDKLDQPVTIQIATLLYSEQADRSLSRLSEQTDIPGAVEIVTSEETTWYLILLGYYHNVEEAEAALLPILPVLRGQSVTEVRIKPSPAWLPTRLSEQGDASAQYNLGVSYDNGYGVPEDDAEAVKWYRLAAEQGHALAQYNLGVSYDNGYGVPEDDAEAVKWYRLAAEQGDASAQYNLGVSYDNGYGVPADSAEAVKWYRLAAEQAHASALFNLGVSYANGQGVLASGAAAAENYYKAGLAFQKQAKKEEALLCVERIHNLEADLTVPNIFSADKLLRIVSGSGKAEQSTADRASPPQNPAAFGTGWITAEGYVVTNFHVVDGHKSIAILLADDTQLTAELALVDKANGLALLLPEDTKSIPVGLPLAGKETSTGTTVFTVGYPHPDLMGSEVKLTNGIISARSGLGGDIRVYQISVPMQAGNSGGPLLNMAGEVVGVVVSKLDAATVFEWAGELRENVNYAIKVEYLRPLIESAGHIRPPLALDTGVDDLVNLVERVKTSVVFVVAQ
jgi:TPR repeat protein